MKRDKIIDLFPDEGKRTQDEIVKELEALVERAKTGEFNNMVFATKLPDGDTATGWLNCDIGLRQELISTMQVDLIYKVVCINLGVEL